MDCVLCDPVVRFLAGVLLGSLVVNVPWAIYLLTRRQRGEGE